MILGATPAAPGWTRINIAPEFSATQSAAGAFDVPTGRISVAWTKNFAEETLELHLATPPGVPVTVRVAGSAPLELPHGANGRWVFPLVSVVRRKSWNISSRERSAEECVGHPRLD